MAQAFQRPEEINRAEALSALPGLTWAEVEVLLDAHNTLWTDNATVFNTLKNGTGQLTTCGASNSQLCTTCGATLERLDGLRGLKIRQIGPAALCWKLFTGPPHRRLPLLEVFSTGS